jgi:hypothetical protein
LEGGLRSLGFVELAGEVADLALELRQLTLLLLVEAFGVLAEVGRQRCDVALKCARRLRMRWRERASACA